MTFPTPIPAQKFLGTYNGITYFCTPYVYPLTREWTGGTPVPDPDPDTMFFGVIYLNWLWTTLTTAQRASWKGYPYTKCAIPAHRINRASLSPYHSFMSYNMHQTWWSIQHSHWPAHYRTTPP